MRSNAQQGSQSQWFAHSSMVHSMLWFAWLLFIIKHSFQNKAGCKPGVLQAINKKAYTQSMARCSKNIRKAKKQIPYKKKMLCINCIAFPIKNPVNTVLCNDGVCIFYCFFLCIAKRLINIIVLIANNPAHKTKLLSSPVWGVLATEDEEELETGVEGVVSATLMVNCAAAVPVLKTMAKECSPADKVFK